MLEKEKERNLLKESIKVFINSQITHTHDYQVMGETTPIRKILKWAIINRQHGTDPGGHGPR